MNSSNDPNHAPLRDVAQSPEATARYLADVQRVLLDIGKNLEILANETRVHLRDMHVEGDRWYHARLRAMPVEKALGQVLKNLNNLTQGLEKSAYKRRAHDETVVNTVKGRKEKELERERKKNLPTLQAAPNPPQQGAQNQNPGYGSPTSIYDLGKRESA
ncbi:hypothetical protein KVH02_34715 [Streptomyces olivaceus]|uniref:Uncharacterized protein n=1 Tax=Streptomyces olivaceus TaxID=47716 RepID=A0ABS7WGF0_STROV|nr:hypothetical protein [Streptomyces olivaceus]MBZ6093418.1 hypothetical protein [Streptomyces olivaceus]MBZ6100555.1 hypothetical protein [Streptomyces olivaceus]MBZ6121656.1 hypothetical protein [Streptomyces olivaceus]MBZ6156251.1 hypothetical protein [Streptomyces olivaceus]MBZ6302903.1 hypothetical protein [Streptomyces olivaceus]